MNVLVSTSTFGQVSDEPLRALRDAGCSVRLNPYGRVLQPRESRKLLVDADGLIAGTEKLDRKTLSSATKLQVIARVGSGTENIDLDAAREQGIEIATTPEPPAQAVAELALAGILASLRGLGAADRDLRAGKWNKPMGRLLAGSTVGIVGTGRAGRGLVQLLSPFRCRILGFDVAPDLSWSKARGVDYVDLDHLLETADIVTLHIPLANDTRGILDRRRIESMKRGAYLVNCARGGLVDEAALAENLANGHLGGVYLDVFETEPYSGALIDAPNTLLSPHIGSYASECRRRMEFDATTAVIRVLTGNLGGT
jgi:D-3-phosphoglycerate dehydrogenase